LGDEIGAVELKDEAESAKDCDLDDVEGLPVGGWLGLAEDSGLGTFLFLLMEINRKIKPTKIRMVNNIAIHSLFVITKVFSKAD
jgi:hypothetical protein